jgi:glycolate oxidase FAD binding subunit
VLSLFHYSGIVDYEPSELVVTARAGTPLRELEAVLAARGQCLGFEPPRISDASTLGGAIASGWSGPARPYRGSARDHVLGVRLLSAEGEVLRFGGQVMKNVAGYDISRLTVGAWGRLGPLLDISVRVYPMPERCCTLFWTCDEADASKRMITLARQFHPMTACGYSDGLLRVRLAGSAAALDSALADLHPESQVEGDSDWDLWRDFSDAWFTAPGEIWQVIVPPATPPLPVQGEVRWDWGGALRWYRTSTADVLAAHARAAGGFMRAWRHPDHARLPSGDVGVLSRRVIDSFAPHGCFNPEG